MIRKKKKRMCMYLEDWGLSALSCLSIYVLPIIKQKKVVRAQNFGNQKPPSSKKVKKKMENKKKNEEKNERKERRLRWCMHRCSMRCSLRSSTRCSLDRSETNEGAIGLVATTKLRHSMDLPDISTSTIYLEGILER